MRTFVSSGSDLLFTHEVSGGHVALKMTISCKILLVLSRGIQNFEFLGEEEAGRHDKLHPEEEKAFTEIIPRNDWDFLTVATL